MDLEVIGRHALLFDDDAMATFVNSPEALVNWNSLSIDRYDVRHLLSSPPPPRNRRRRLTPRSPSPNPDDSLESELDHERYLDLPSQSDDEQDLENEAQAENASGYHAVSFSYGAPEESSDQKNIDAKSSFHPPFSLPEHLLQNLPPTEKVHHIIARTALFVSKYGGQSEIVLRVKQGDNPTFGFLLPDHNLHPYFRFLVDNQELLKSDVDEKSIGEEKKTDGDLHQMGGVGGALSLLGSVYGSGEDEEGATEDAVALAKSDFEEAVNTDNATVSHGSEQTDSSSNAVWKDATLSKPSLPYLNEKSHVIKKNRYISTIKSGTITGVKKDGDSMGSFSSTVDKSQPSISTSLSKVEQLVLEPPSDMKRVVDKIVEFILRNGKEFEAVLVQQDTKHGRFPFLLPSNQYHPYYLKAFQKAQESRLAGKNFTSEKHNSMGHGMEKKSENGENDTVTLGSDIPYESNRKEKFKMIIGKSKKDEKDPSSKATQPQVGVSVDAAAAAAILQAATRGIKNPNLEILSKKINSIDEGPSSGGGGSLHSSWPQNSNQKPNQNEEQEASKADSSAECLTREQKVKAERLKRAKMFAAMIKGGAAPVKSESLRGLSAEPSESGQPGSDSQVSHPVGGERDSSSVLMDFEACNKIVKAEKKGTAEEHNERRSKRSYRSRSKRGEEGEGEEEEEEEGLKEDRDHKHSRKKRRSHRSSHHSRDKHKHRKRPSSSHDREPQRQHEEDSSSEDENRRSGYRRKRDSSSDYEQRYSRHKHRHYGSSSEDEHRRSRHRHKHDSSSDDEQTRSRRKHRHYSSSDDKQRPSRHKHRRYSSSDDEQRRSRRKHRHYSSSDDEQRHSRRRHGYDSSPGDEYRHTQRRHKQNASSDDDEMRSRRSRGHDTSDDEHRYSQHPPKYGTSDDEDSYQAKPARHRKISHSEREADLEEGEILMKSDQSKVSEDGDRASREPSVDLSKSSQPSETAEVSNDLRAKVRAMLMRTL